MEKINLSQQENIRNSIEDLQQAVDILTACINQMPIELWRLSTYRFEGGALLELLRTGCHEVKILERAARGEIEPVEQTPTGFSKDSK